MAVPSARQGPAGDPAGPSSRPRQVSSVGAGACDGSPSQFRPASSAFSDALSVCPATVSTISSSDIPSPAACVDPGSLIVVVLSCGERCPSSPPRAGRRANQRGSPRRRRQLEPDPLATVVLL